MKTERNILIAFILNLALSAFEVVGGIFTGSVAIVSDALHDFGDAVSIGVSYFLEKKSKRNPDSKYTYGYARYSVLGGCITTLILILGSAVVIYNSLIRFIKPVEINYTGMLLFAVVGAGVNVFAAFFTRNGDSLNQKAVNLHLLEDALGWLVVLVGAIVMKFTDLRFIDPLMSIGVAVFILVTAIKTLYSTIEIFLEKTPHGIQADEILNSISQLDGVIDVHHVHIWSMDEQKNFATMHIVAAGDFYTVKKSVRAVLSENGISHATLELEDPGEHCESIECRTEPHHHKHCHHHH